MEPGTAVSARNTIRKRHCVSLKNKQSYLGYGQVNSQLKYITISAVLLFLNQKYLIEVLIFNLELKDRVGEVPSRHRGQ